MLVSKAGSVFGFTIVAMFAVACTPSKPSSLRLLGDEDRIFSTAPQLATTGVYLIKLDGPALLSTITTTPDGKKSPIDPEVFKAVTKQQDDVVAKLKELSPDIKLIYRYRLVLNAVAIVAPAVLKERIGAISNVVSVQSSGHFDRPVLQDESVNASDESPPANIATHNSSKFIGAEEAHARGISGQGMRVGIIDTGIDYTHAMFGGAGTPEAYKSVDPAKPNAAFPNKKVVGGIDLVGTAYDSGSGDFTRHIPEADMNPIDEAGHGSHVAGTVAGIGDGVNTYTGIAPDASLYAIKVFGKVGSTDDTAVIAGLEFAADPTGKGDLSDQLDVVNLSLGSGFGESHSLYSEAIGNLSKAGTVVVASAGNDGDNEFIVGAPSVSVDALSVAASTDDQDANYIFPAVQFVGADGKSLAALAAEASSSKPIVKAGDISGPVVFLGLGNQDLTPEIIAQVKGKIAFFDRGVATFETKFKFAAAAGAIGVVVADNAEDNAPPGMSLGKSKFKFPGVGITKAQGAELKAMLAKGEVIMHFKTSILIQRPELIDTIAGFSSKGPRSFDALIKPEISAPGSMTISVKMGSGNKGTKMSGTSMASPHMTGVMTLIKQTRKTFASNELISMAMGTSKTLVDEKKQIYPVSRQGAGRVQILAALDAKLISLPSALSLGEVTIGSRKILQKTMTLKNISANDLDLKLAFEGNASLTMTGANALSLKAGASQVLTLRFVIDSSALKDDSNELDGWVKVTANGAEVNRVPVLAVVNKVAEVQAGTLAIRSTSATDSNGAVVDLTLKNTGVNDGEAYPFNLIALDRRKQDARRDSFRTKGCDLQGAGYRVIDLNGVKTFQVALKVYERMSTWGGCQVSVLIDSDGDGIADQELAGAVGTDLKGISDKVYESLLLDAAKARAIRKQFEADTIAHRGQYDEEKPDDGDDDGDDDKKPKKIEENYEKAVIVKNPATAIAQSTVVIVQTPIKWLATSPSGALNVQIATSYGDENAVEPDDFLIKDRKTWLPLNVGDQGAGFVDLPEKLTLKPGESQTVSITKGIGSEKLWMLYPQNLTVTGSVSNDLQSQVLSPIYDTAPVTPQASAESAPAPAK